MKPTTMINWPAVRAYRRATRALDESAQLARDADHAVCPDGYGAAALEDAIDRDRLRTAVRIAPRFGLTAKELQHLDWMATHVETDRFRAALCGNALLGMITGQLD